MGDREASEWECGVERVRRERVGRRTRTSEWERPSVGRCERGARTRERERERGGDERVGRVGERVRHECQGGGGEEHWSRKIRVERDPTNLNSEQATWKEHLFLSLSRGGRLASCQR